MYVYVIVYSSSPLTLAHVCRSTEADLAVSQGVVSTRCVGPRPPFKSQPPHSLWGFLLFGPKCNETIEKEAPWRRTSDVIVHDSSAIEIENQWDVDMNWG